jgi:hypothetical protein
MTQSVEAIKAEICTLGRQLEGNDPIDVARSFLRLDLANIMKFNPDGVYVDLDAIPKNKEYVLNIIHGQITYKLSKPK